MKQKAVFPTLIAGLLIATPGVVASVSAQASPAAAQERYAARASYGGAPGGENGAVTLDVVVTDKSGAPVSGLKSGDFKLLDNRQPQNLASFRPESGMDVKSDQPVELILLVDAVNSDVVETDAMRQQLANFLKRNGGELVLPTSFIFLTGNGAKVEGYGTRDGNNLLKVLNDNASGVRTMGRAGGAWGASERRSFSLQALSMIAAQERKVPGRKLLVWIGGGWAAFSGSSPLKSEKDNQMLFSSISNLSTELREARITIYSVDPNDGVRRGQNQFYYQNFLKGVSTPKQTDFGDLLLQVLATQSGGQVIFGSTDLAGLIDRRIAEARNFYVLSFNAAAAKVPNEYHELSVQIDKPGLTARTRTGYYAQP